MTEFKYCEAQEIICHITWMKVLNRADRIVISAIRKKMEKCHALSEMDRDRLKEIEKHAESNSYGKTALERRTPPALFRCR